MYNEEFDNERRRTRASPRKHCDCRTQDFEKDMLTVTLTSKTRRVGLVCSDYVSRWLQGHFTFRRPCFMIKSHTPRTTMHDTMNRNATPFNLHILAHFSNSEGPRIDHVQYARYTSTVLSQRLSMRDLGPRTSLGFACTL
jgi:hypothetical protein